MNTEEKFLFVRNALKTKSPFFGDILAKIEPIMDHGWKTEMVNDLETMFGNILGSAFRDALDGYIEFSVDAAKNQNFFLKHGRYKASKFAEVKRDLLDDPEHMLKRYLPGLFISHYFWPHHYRMRKRYLAEILPKVRERRPNLFMEVGTGSAMYTLLTMSGLPEIRGIGYDISPHSIMFGRRVASAFGLSDRLTLLERDAFSDPPQDKADYIVSHEVVEHLENPAIFCRNLNSILNDNGCAYITAAITAAHSDHIYLFRSPAEFENMLVDAGFRSVLYLEESSIDNLAPDMTPRICGHFLVKA